MNDNDLNSILNKVTALQDIPEPYVLKKLLSLLRVNHNVKNAKQLVNSNFEQFIETLKAKPEYAKGLTTFILNLLNKNHKMSLFTDTGILSYGFMHNLMRLMGHRFIPLLPDNDNMIEIIDYLFDDRDDIQWLEEIDTSLWQQLVSLLAESEIDDSLVATVKNNLINAMVVLSYRINGLGLHQDLMQAYPEIVDFSAAFVTQNQETLLFADQYRRQHGLETYQQATDEIQASTAPLLVMLEQCEHTVTTIRKRIYKTGISIRLTNMLLRLEQKIDRLRLLSEMLSDGPQIRDKAIIEFSKVLIISAKQRYSIGYLFRTNTELLSRKVTENAGRVGEHYISTNKAGFKKMFKKAAIGGFVIAFMATLKILSSSLDLAPMGRAFVNSMIYGLGFVFIHIIHGTVATKQPAMTAAAIASTISQGSGKKSQRLSKLSEIMVDILRTQFVAIMGNVLLAMPLAFAISFAWLHFTGQPMIDFDKAEHLLHDLNPITSLALFHAAIAGVYLFLAGLIAGFYDNLAVFNRIGDRIGRHKLLLKVMPSKLTQRLGNFVESNLGAIMGNFLFGVFLGSTATIGYIFGLPLDIRHIAFSSANFAHGIFNIPADYFSLTIIFISLLGVVLIGIVNLMVSFTLALLVALRSKGVRFSEWKTIYGLLFTHLVTNTRDFFWPRPEPMQYAHINDQGQMIYGVNDPNNSAHETLADAADLQSKSAVRHLSDMNVVPEAVKVDEDKLKKSQTKKQFQQDLINPNITVVNSKPSESIILKDNVSSTELNKEDINLVTQNNSLEKPKSPSLSDKGEKDSQSQSSTSGNEDRQKLLKPKKPPQLPD